MKSAAAIVFVSSLVTMAAQAPPTVATIYDEDVRVERYVALSYPGVAQRANIRGVVLVQVGLDANGDVIRAERLSGPVIVDAAALDNVKQWKFSAKKTRRAIVAYDFQLDQHCSDEARSFRLRHWNLAIVTACVPLVDVQEGRR
jgi:TonB family protein